MENDHSKSSTTAPDAEAAALSTPPAASPADAARRGKRRRGLTLSIGVVFLLLALIVGVPRLLESLSTVSTDDAYVNGHVTFVAPRVAGQVARVLVDDHHRVRKGELLVQLDKEPYQVRVEIAQADLATAQADLVAAQAHVRGIAAEARSLRFDLDHAIEDVHNQLALLNGKAATLESRKATLAKAQSEYDHVLQVQSGAVAQEVIDRRKEAVIVAQAQVAEALESASGIRVALGLPPKPESGDNLTLVPADLDQTASTVRRAQARLIQAVAQLGVSDSFNKTPRQMIVDFYKRDPQGDIDRILAKLMKEAPAIKQAEAKLAMGQRNVEQARLDLRYCDIISEIDGVVTRREVNPGNNVVTGQSLMAVRSLTEIWVDANFKETQLADLRIGQTVDLNVDMYGSRQSLKGRVSGFTMGTGSTLALLPAENATGNFVKVVQRLPVRIDLVDYDPDRTPLFIGLSVTPRVHVKEPPTGPDAGRLLQGFRPEESSPAGPASKPVPGALR